MSERVEHNERRPTEELSSGSHGEKWQELEIEDASFSYPYSYSNQRKNPPYSKLGRKEDILYRESDRDRLRFELHKKIGDFTYSFKIYKKHGDTFGINIETEEYDFALTQQNKKEQEEYFETIRTIVETINKEATVIKEIVISPAGEAYTTKEIEACKKELLTQDSTLRAEELDRMYGFRVLQMYEEINKKPFPLERSKDKSRGVAASDARYRFFRIYFKKYFPDWEVHEEYTGDFSLVKKE